MAMTRIINTLALATTALAASRTSAPEGCLNVDQSGGDYSTIQAAVDALSTSDSETQCIFINPGTYTEQVLVSERSAQLTFYGYTEDTSSYVDNQVEITYNLGAVDGYSDDETGTLRVKAENFKMYNVNVNNAYGEGTQAIALSAYSSSGFYGCSFTGYQDTLLSEQGAQVYAASLIQGATDFVFGQSATSWFYNDDIRVVAASKGYVTADGPNDPDTGIYVFDECDIAAASGNTVAAGAYYLGRPWSENARVVFQSTSMSDVINSAGWSEWSSSEPNTSGDLLFAEYANTGDGASGTRASFATTLSAPYAISDVLGSSYASQGYYDASYF